eukprot:353696-Chlamydomonas_euryale.AAC.1
MKNRSAARSTIGISRVASARPPSIALAHARARTRKWTQRHCAAPCLVGGPARVGVGGRAAAAAFRAGVVLWEASIIGIAGIVGITGITTRRLPIRGAGGAVRRCRRDRAHR